jgi:hypothetical protein
VGHTEPAVESIDGVALDQLGDDIEMLGEQAGAVSSEMGLTGRVAFGGEGGKLRVDLGVAGPSAREQRAQARSGRDRCAAPRALWRAPG